MFARILTGLSRVLGLSSGSPGVMETRLSGARAAQQSGRLDEAERICVEILSEDGACAQAHHLLGRLLAQRGAYDDAARHLEDAIAAAPEAAEPYCDYGNVLRMQGKVDAAVDNYRKALGIAPDFALAHCNLGLALKKTDSMDAAIHSLRQAVRLQPDFVAAQENLALLLVEAGRYDEALELATRGTERHPEAARMHAILGLVLLKLDRPEKASEVLEHAIKLNPVLHRAWNSLGIALQHLGDIEGAIARYDRALELSPDYHMAHMHRALALLLKEDFAQGWPEYEHRLLTRRVTARDFGRPRWDGSSLEDRTVLVYAEQGLGDEIMFASCLPDLVARAGHCVVDCAEKLASIFQRSFPGATIHGGTQQDDTSWLSGLPDIDVQIPIGSLPLYLRNNAGDFPDHKGYLRADPGRIAAWRERLAGLGNGLKIGISWRGGTSATYTARRSTDLDEWMPVLQIEGAHFVSLQYGDSGAEAAVLEDRAGIRVHHWQPAIDDYEETAALVCALDLVISVQTAIVHLTGALGRPVWVLVSASPEWRYGMRGKRMCWYPEARLYRQRQPGVWGDPMREVSRDLCGLIAVGGRATGGLL